MNFQIKICHMIILCRIAAVLLLITLPGPGFGKSVTVGAVLDGPSSRRGEILALFTKEMTALNSSEHSITFSPDKIVVGDWNSITIGKFLKQLLDDPEVDIVLAAGLVASDLAIRQQALPKPVIAPFIMDRKLQNAPFKAGISGVRNLSYLESPHNIERDILFFKELHPFNHLAFVVNGMLPRTSPGFTGRVEKLAKTVGGTIEVVPGGLSADSILNSLPAGTDAVYIYSLEYLEKDEFDILVQGLNSRKLPSFSCLGEREVEKGVMVSLSPDPFKSISRRIAVSIQRILMGEDPATFPVRYSTGERLTFNMETARIIGFEPPWTVLNEANIVGKIRPKKGRKVSMKKVALEANDLNLELAAGEHGKASARQEMKASWSALMPKLEVGGTGLVLEPEMAEAAMGTQPQYSGNVYGKVTQVVFSEQANANISIQKHKYAATKNQLQQLKLNIVMDVTEAYISVLRAHALEKIRRKNMERIRTYLQLARMRMSVGSASQGEVYRWESQIAVSQKELIEANSIRNQAEIAINRLLARPQEEPFIMKEQNQDYQELLNDWQHYNRCFSTKSAFWSFREFMVAEALANSPELKALDEAIAIQERLLSAANRVIWVPTLAVQGQVDNMFYRAGKGSNTPPGYPDDFNWTVGANLSLPIYQGNEAFVRRKGHKEAMSQKRLDRKATGEKIEQRMRSHLHQAGASFAGMSQAQKAATAAAKGLEMVKDAYARGAVSISELTDARAQAQIAAEAESDAVFNYLLSLMKVQRAGGQFDFFRTAEEETAFKKRLGTRMKEKSL